MNDNERKVKISGGTFFLCLWLFFIQWELGRIANALIQIAEKMK